MTRLGSLVFCAVSVMGIAFHGCGGDSSGGGTGGSGVGGTVSGGGALGTGGAGSGLGGTGVVEAIIPRDNTVTGWVVDPSEPKVAGKVAAIATTQTAAVDYIDGGADPFYSASFTPSVFAWQNYMNSTVNPPDGYTVKLYVLQLPSVAQATALYDSLIDGTHSLYSTNTWADTSPVIGDRARITNSGTDWWINFRKGVYYSEVRLTYAEKTDLVGQQQTVSFATAVAAKM
jgi:hypothetical protein